MLVKDALGKLDLGSSVAEFDAELRNYFVETATFRSLVRGQTDIIAGDKGTGKTAMYKVLRERYREIEELKGIEIIAGFNPAGNPVFQRLAQLPPLTEGQYATIWKSYFLSLVGNWLLEILGGPVSDNTKLLDGILQKLGLRSADEAPQTVFSKLVNRIKRLMSPAAVEMGISISEAGLPVLTPRIEFAEKEEGKAATGPQEVIQHEDALKVLDACLAEVGLNVWIALDRLDEAFQGYPDIERPALRALLRTYLDMLDFPTIRLKLFLRKDLFRKVVHGGFVNLTHVNAKRLDIVWEEDDLKALLCNRVRRDQDFLNALGVDAKTDDQVFAVLFPPQVDAGPRKASTWAWMMSRIKDGNGIRPPRNLVDLAKKAQESQLRAEERTPRQYAAGSPLIEPDALRKALQRLSDDRVNDTLLAEAPDLAPMIERFRDGKAEQNIGSLSTLLNVPEDAVKGTIKPLLEIGFLEETRESFKVPILYRDGLNITQGKAFAAEGAVAAQDTDE